MQGKTIESPTPATRLPGPPELIPGRPDAVVDLQTDTGAALVGAEWRYSDARVEEIDFVELGSPEDPLGPGTVPARTYDVVPHAEAADYDDSDWRVLRPEGTLERLANGRVCFNWYRLSLLLPELVGDTEVTGATVVFEVVVDDYAEVWVNGKLPQALGDTGGPVVGGFNSPNRVILTRDARPGERFQIAVFGINGPISASPPNYIWMRTATLELYAAGRAQLGFEAPLEVEGDLGDAHLEQVAGGFEFTEGPLWSPEGALLFSSPNTNVIYRWDATTGAITLFNAKSGYSGPDIGRFGQPGSNGLAFDPEGRLVMCQHGNRRVLRVNRHGDTTVLADSYAGKRLNSPNDLVFRSDGTLFFTDPPFGLPEMFDDADKELDFSGVFQVRGGEISLVTDELTGPNGLALSPNERYLYVGNWDPERKVVMRYEADAGGPGEVLFDMTDASGEDAVDGIKVDRDGNLFVCGPGGIWVLSQEGLRLGLLRLPEAPHNLAWGDEDGRTLYITALTGVYRLRLTKEEA